MGLSNLDDTVVRRESLGLSITTGGASAFSAAALGIVAAIAIPSLFRARGAANEAAAIGTLRSLASAQATFQAKNGRFGTMAELADADMINRDIRNGVERNGYVFREVRPTAKTFEFSAAPVGTASGGNSYNIVEDFVVRYSESKVPPRRKAGKPIG
jgi:Tfp pilus assembly protein PilE